MKAKLTYLLFFIAFSLTLLAVYLVLRYFGYITVQNRRQPLEIISDMDHQNKLKADFIPYDEEGKVRDVRLNPNAIPLEDAFYPLLPYEIEKAENLEINEIPADSFMLKRGELLFLRFCVPCHGLDGRGNGPIVTKVQLSEEEEGFPPPKDLSSEGTKMLSNKRLFHILGAGQNLMFPFHSQLTYFDKWSLIHYIRKLQNDKK